MHKYVFTVSSLFGDQNLNRKMLGLTTYINKRWELSLTLKLMVKVILQTESRLLKYKYLTRET